ncbi:DUF47 domain-containing protein [Methanospirillum stamsii]|uniref:DUF47 domain-containing protein n=1 Tax=Methanospirillum stamsii TaxID=1277351 RepID=A0A2V2N294_9EURY|nr:DUF47 family protein [Methanospirillum stamsii]PWR71836.1 DUF47 domain-containing protein [Methanospirillum stamsii]
MRIRDIILPEDKYFLELFCELSDNIVSASGYLTDLISGEDLSHGHNCQKIHQLEHESDELLRRLFERLEESLVTPLEPDEIQRLAKALDDVIDIIDWVAHQICNYQLSGTYPHLAKFAEFISVSTIEIQKGVHLLGKWEEIKDIKTSCSQINQIWNRSSDLLSSAVTELFSLKDPIQVIKLKDIYENLEEVLQECNDVGHVLNEIIIRHK